MHKTYEEMKDSGVEWIGRIPTVWQVLKLKYITDCLDGRRIPVDAAQRVKGPYPYWGAGAIMDYVDKYIFDEELILLGEDGAPFFDNTRDVAHLVRGKIWVNNHIHVLKPNSLVNNSFLTHYLNIVNYRSYINGSILNKLTQGNMNKIMVALPPLSEQAAIAAYLDDKCGAIDGIITETKAGIEEYKAWKASVIFEAVTKGLDPNAEMKDSGVEWIGQIPAGWSVCKVKHLCSMQAGKNLTSEEIEDTGSYPVYGGNGLRGFYSSFNQDRQCVLVGRQGALCGNVHFVKGRFWATDHAVVTLPTSAEDCKHLYYLLGCMNLNQYASETTAQPGLSVSLVQNLPSILTPPQEQVAIAAYLDDKCSAIDSIIAEKEALIAELETYKKSLILETVTGKRRVC